MQWFYSKDGQQVGPVEFSEIERLHAEGLISGDTLVWQQGTANWVKLSTLLSPAAGSVAGAPIGTVSPATVTSGPITPGGPGQLPDYGPILCWGILGIIIPCVSLLVFIALIVLHILEYFAVRKEVTEGRLQPTDYSKVHPALFIAGLICCGGFLYPVFMYLRNKSGYFKPQPHAVWVAIVAILVNMAIVGVQVVAQFAAQAAIQQ